MSRIVEVKELRRGDMFELPNGSVYEAEGSGDQHGAQQRARLWCAHPPDAITFEPPPAEFPPDQQVQLLSGEDMKEHSRHEGYVKKMFHDEMDRRNDAMMQSVHRRGQQAADEQRRRDHAGRSWWKKLFG